MERLGQVAGRCLTYVAGKVCVNRLERGYRTEMQERGQLLVNPASGQWIEPRWVRVGRVIDGKTTSKTVDLCDPSCTRRTEYKSSSVYNSPISGYDEGLRQLGTPIRSDQEPAGRVPVAHASSGPAGCDRAS